MNLFSSQNKETFFYIKKENFKKYNLLKKLLEISDCPDELWLSRDFEENEIINNPNTKFISIVGSRQHSVYAKEVLKKIISEIKNQPIVIISGLALGIDALAHKFALENNIPTIAIPGSGLSKEVLYPKTNFKLAEEITNQNGLLISELSPDTKAAPWSFPKRNRIMAALSDLVFVVEAKEKSGTLITAKLALEYNKNLATVPNSIFSDYSKGSNNLIKQGAYTILNGSDILEILNLNNIQESLFPQENKNNNLSEEEVHILRLLSEPQSKDFLVKNSGFNISKLNTLLSILEIKGVIKESLGKYHKN